MIENIFYSFYTYKFASFSSPEPGTFEFSKPSLLFKESCGKAQIPIERVNGADGKIEIKWKTEDMSAHTGQDYEGGEGVLVFEHGETTKMLEIPVYDDQVSSACTYTCMEHVQVH